jgi:hypothetical protein
MANYMTMTLDTGMEVLSNLDLGGKGALTVEDVTRLEEKMTGIMKTKNMTVGQLFRAVAIRLEWNEQTIGQ